MWDYHQGLTEFAYDSKTDAFTPTHGYYSEAWSWILLRRPVNFYVLDVGDQVRQILTIGNPALFWGSVVGAPLRGVVMVAPARLDGRVRDRGLLRHVAPLVRREPARSSSSTSLPLTPFMALATVSRLARPGRGPSRASRGRRPRSRSIPRPGEPAISSRTSLPPHRLGLPGDLRGAVRLVLAALRRGADPRHVLAAAHLASHVELTFRSPD